MCVLLFVDRFGRRNCLIYGSAAMFIFFIIYTILGDERLYPNSENLPSNRPVGQVMIAVTFFFIFKFSITWAPCAYVVASELFPPRVKSKGMAIAISSGWLADFLLAFFTPFIIGAIGFSYGYVFSGCFVICICVHHSIRP
jgi:MFS transporter, SP family, sugar:H+ symporter